MTRRIVASDARRSASSRRGNCALAALVGVLLAFAPVAAAQDLRLQPAAVDAEAVDDEQEATPPEPASDESTALDSLAASPSDRSSDTPAATDAPLSSAAVEPAAADNTPPQASRRGSEAASPPAVTADLRTALDKSGNLNLHDVELRAALFMISEQWGINIVAGEVKGSVNGVFRQAPLREILDAILLSNGYNYRAVGESLVISSVADLGQINPFFQSATIPVQAADIDEIVQGARLLTTPQGQIQAIKSARCIVVLDFPDRVQMIRDFVTSIDRATRMSAGGMARAGQPLEVAHFRTQHIAAKTAEDALQAVLSKDGRVATMEKEDRLVVSDYAENLAMVEMVLQRIDRPRPQVRITALIYDISLEDLEQLGINWNQIGYRSGDNTRTGLGIGTRQVQGSVGGGIVGATLSDGVSMAFGALSRHFEIAAVATALQGAKDTRLLADPSVAVLENEQAVFKSVQEIPIQQLTQTGQGGQIGTTTFREAGVKLTVTPKIAADGTIRMHVSPEFSRQNGADLQGQPIIDTRVAETVLSAANRQTIVIAGLRQREDIGEFSGVPYLKDIHGVGKLFRSRDTRVRESELVVFISAEIISPADPLNHREAEIVDTIGCRLNQIPEPEGCPPPCDCAPTMPPLRLPEPESDYAAELPPLASHAVPQQNAPHAAAATRPPRMAPARVATEPRPESAGTLGAAWQPLRVASRPQPTGPHAPPPFGPPPVRGQETRAQPGQETRAQPVPFTRAQPVAIASQPPLRRLPTVDREQPAAPAVAPTPDLFAAPPAP